LAERPYPDPEPLVRPFWEAVAAGRLDIQRCSACRRFVFYPRAICPHCGSGPLEWVTTAGRGTVHAFTVAHRAPEPFSAEVPYVVALVDLDEGVRMMTRLVGIETAEVSVGLPVRLSISGDPPLPTFTLEVETDGSFRR
jgi:uncharacterized OB-fold protein